MTEWCCYSPACSESVLSKILVIETGGTISCKRNAVDGKLAPQVGVVKRHIEHHDSFDKIRRYIDVISFPHPIDSSNLSISNWREIVEVIEDHYKLYRGFVITHGTDTLAYTAAYLSFCFFFQSFPIVLTAAQCPLESSYSDAHNNLYGACVIALGFDPELVHSLSPSITGNSDAPTQNLSISLPLLTDSLQQQQYQWFFPETVVFMNHKCMLGNRVRKLDATAIDSFDSPSEDYLGIFHSTFAPDREVLRRLCATRVRSLTRAGKLFLPNGSGTTSTPNTLMTEKDSSISPPPHAAEIPSVALADSREEDIVLLRREQLVDVSLVVAPAMITPALIKLYPCAIQLTMTLETLYSSGIRHFILEAFGSGNASDSVREFVTNHVADCYFAVCTQCLTGFARAIYSTAIDAHPHIAICANMTPECAFAKMTNWAALQGSSTLAIARAWTFQRYMLFSLRDELDDESGTEP